MAPHPNKKLLAEMDTWPDDWAIDQADKAFGAGLAAELVSFVVHLHSLGLAPRTVRKHLDNLWVIGGELIRGMQQEPELRKKQPRDVLLEAIDIGEAPLVRDASEEEQRSFDATARRLLRFLTSPPPRQ